MSNKRHQMRLFVASPVVMDHYIAIRKDFEGIIEGKWVKEKNLHLTWVFLGDIEDIKPLIGQLNHISPLENAIDISDLGCFGRPPKILYAKTQEQPFFHKAKEFASAGFKLDGFQPHITLCRIKKIHNHKAYNKMIRHYQGKILGSVMPQIFLYQSILDEKGPTYKRLFHGKTIKG